MSSKHTALAAGALIALVLGVAAGLYWLAGDDPGTGVMPPAALEVRDSAGIRIVENPLAREGDLPEWTLSAQPVVRIGTLDGPDEAYLLNGVRHGTVLSDGSIALSSARPAEVRIFDREGRFVRRVGRPGEGPGEFGSVQRLVELAPDTLAVQDQARRVNVFGRDGQLLSTLPGPFQWGRESPSGLTGSHWVWIGEGRFLVIGRTPSSWPDTTVWRPPTRLTLWDRKTPGESQVLGEFPGSEQYRANDGGPLWDFPMVIPIFGRRTLWEREMDRVHVADTGRDEVLVFGVGGRLDRIVRMSSAPVPVTEADREAAIREERDAGYNEIIVPPDLRAEFERIVEQLPTPAHHPPITGLRADRSGRLWVGRPAHVDATERLWEVFDREGIAQARLRVPIDLEVLEFGDDHVLGIRRDELDVEFAELYRMERS